MGQTNPNSWVLQNPDLGSTEPGTGFNGTQNWVQTNPAFWAQMNPVTRGGRKKEGEEGLVGHNSKRKKEKAKGGRRKRGGRILTW
ncbi:hypothetical protein SLEP1_g5299 [Rubroshorea leprosula]|uniref:Uncharacterized protein n=1 Tax=Rubroshorea leprosula TaxID=152421 RepID=A0AAV5I230_9ROSI|nr:hypothetical protein SLEP1_g5299 [Rubroshorea leprosula]